VNPRSLNKKCQDAPFYLDCRSECNSKRKRQILASNMLKEELSTPDNAHGLMKSEGSNWLRKQLKEKRRRRRWV
jgi:hypothetical protein